MVAVKTRHAPADYYDLDIAVDPALQAAQTAYAQQLPGHDSASDDEDDDDDANGDDDEYRPPSGHAADGDMQVGGDWDLEDGGRGGARNRNLDGQGPTPEGYRFCTGCRANKPEDNFEGQRKLCTRHKEKAKYHQNPPPDAISLEEMGIALRAESDLSGCERFEGTLLVENFPQELCPPIPTEKKDEDIEAAKSADADAEAMRAARAKCRALVEFIHQKTGYAFVYKDCRSGRRLKYAHSLRYLCSQRLDQDFSKRRSSDKKRFEDEMLESNEAAAMLGMTLGAVPEGEEEQQLDLSATTNAAIAAMLQQQQQQQQQEQNGDLNIAGALNMHEVAKKAQEDYSRSLNLDALNSAEADGADDLDPDTRARIQAEHDMTAEIARAVAAAALQQPGGIASGSGSGEHDLEHDELMEHEHDELMDIDVHAESSHPLIPLDPYLEGHQHSYAPSNEDEDHDHDDDAKPTTKPKGRGKGWRRGTGKVVAKPKAPMAPRRPSTKPRAPIKKMERYECRGTLIINLLHDEKTAYFVITHFENHPEYVDVVGNRLRGARLPPPPVNLSTSMVDPVGSWDFDGTTAFDRTEAALKGLLETVRDLRTKNARDPGGGEEEAVQAIYDMTEGARKKRVSVQEAIAKGRPPGGHVKKEKKERRPAAPKKRKAESGDDLHPPPKRCASPIDSVHIAGLVEQYLGMGTTSFEAGVDWSIDPNLQASDSLQVSGNLQVGDTLQASESLETGDLVVMPEMSEAGPSEL